MAILVKLDNPKQGIITPVSVWPSNQKYSSKIYQAQWSTGAPHTAISKKVLNNLDLEPVGASKSGYVDNNGIWRVSTELVYVVNILVSDSIISRDIKVNAIDLEEVDIMIGLDIISHGDFTLYKQKGETIFTFRLIESEKDEISPRGIEDL